MHRGGGQGVVVEEGTRPVAETKLQHAGPALHAPEQWPHNAQVGGSMAFGCKLLL